MARPRIAVALLLACGALLAPPVGAQQPAPEAIGRVFLEAEAKNWIKAWLDAHPPNTALTGLGGKTVFVIELLMAADAYRRADNDKGRFHAAASGAAAYVAYSYSATPAVGLIVTAVYLCAQIIEGAVAGSYAEAMLEIQKAMVKTEMIRQDLVYRYGMSRAYRVLALSQGLLSLVEQSAAFDREIAFDCKSAADYGALAHCMDRVTRSMATRAMMREAIARLMLLPDRDLDLLAATQREDGTIQEAPPGAQRAELQKALDEAEKTLADMRTVYEPMAAKFADLSAILLIDEAGDESAPFVAREQIYWACLAQHTRLVYEASAMRLQLAAVSAQLGKEKLLDGQRQKELSELQTGVSELLQDFEQRRMTCPDVREDTQMLMQFSELRLAMASVAR